MRIDFRCFGPNKIRDCRKLVQTISIISLQYIPKGEVVECEMRVAAKCQSYNDFGVSQAINNPATPSNNKRRL